MFRGEAIIKLSLSLLFLSYLAFCGKPSGIRKLLVISVAAWLGF